MPPLCGVCAKEPSRYKCPACGTQTCSLECLKQHKVDKNCTGKVDPARFVSWKELGESLVQVNRDYNFLTNTGRHLEVHKDVLRLDSKNLFKRPAGYGRRPPPKRFKAEPQDSRISIVSQVFPHEPPMATKRKNTLVISVPPGMSRAMANKSGYDKKTGEYVWSVEWVILADDGGEIGRHMSYRLAENSALAAVVPMNLVRRAYGDEGDSIESATLAFYLLNVANTSSERSVFALERTATLSDALADRIVLEYPTIYVSRNGATIGEICTNYERTVAQTTSLDSDSDSEASDGSSSEADSSSDSEQSDSESDLAPEELSSKPPPLNSEEINLDM